MSNIFGYVKQWGLWFKNLSRRSKIIVSVVILVILFFAGRSLFFSKKQPQYTTDVVTRGTLIDSVTESGNVASGSVAGVGSPTTGVITDIFVKDGDTVTAGQNLFKVKSVANAQEVASAWASYQSAVSSANTATSNKVSAQATLEKDRAAVIAASSAVTDMNNNLGASQPNPATKQSYTQNDIDGINSALTSSQETFSADEQKYNNTDASITAATASENSAWLSYQATQDSVVTAPVDGTVTNIAYKVGDQVTASSGNLTSELSSSGSNSSSNPVMGIGNFSAPYIKIQASEVDIPKIQAGQKATITLSAFSGKTFIGNVDQVDSVGANSSGVVTYNVFVTLLAAPADIKPGMSATVTIQTQRKDDTLYVPSAAVQTTNGQTDVRVLQNGKVSLVPVSIGLTTDTDTEITSGLTEGETVVTGVVTTGASGATSSPFGGGFGGARGFGGGGGGAIFRTGGGGGGGGARGG